MTVRIAREDDAKAACDVVCRSIRELCTADHGGDARTIESWLANKTPDNVRSWINDRKSRLIVAEVGDAVVGVGSVTLAGSITLNYVAPEARYQGVSKRILAELESYLRGRGVNRSTLSSTRTAYAFYRAAGYVDAGPPQKWRNMLSYPMTKTL